jgi:hypothetical protein
MSGKTVRCHMESSCGLAAVDVDGTIPLTSLARGRAKVGLVTDLASSWFLRPGGF